MSAYGTAGGNDTANLYDSPGDDRLSANSKSAFISGPGFYSQARHFESVIGHATAGGNDYASIYADSAEQAIHHTGDLVQLDAGSHATRSARGFERVETFLLGSVISLSPASLALDAGESAVEIQSPLVIDEVSEVKASSAKHYDDSELVRLLTCNEDKRLEEERSILDELFAEL